VQVFTPDGKPTGVLDVQADGQTSGRLTLLTSPSAHAALLGFTETVPDPSLGDQVRLTRIDCVEPL
jgi:hypothetical protein